MDRARLRELLDEHTLLPNYALSSLPPLPQTPHHSRHVPTTSDDEQAYEPRSQRRRGPERDYMSSTRRPRVEAGKLTDTLPRSSTLPALSLYPTLSTRQSSLNTARNVSPQKLDFMSPQQPFSALLHPSSAVEPRASRNISASFMLPQMDVSMLQDVTLGDLARVSLGNETMETGEVARRDIRTSPVKPVASPSRRPPVESTPIPSRTTSIRRARTYLTVPTQDADMSTFLPVSPLKTRHLLSDEYLLTQTQIEDETMNMSLAMPPISTRKAHTPRSARMASADMTMDIQQMMAKIKPEESLLDLRREIDDDQDISMMGNILPSGLVRSKSLSRMATEKRNPSPTRTLPRPTMRVAQPSPVKGRPIARRVSLSVGAAPLPTATLRKLELPSRLQNPSDVAPLPSRVPQTAKPRTGSTVAAPVPRAAAARSLSRPAEVKVIAGLRAPGRSALPQPGSGPSARSGTQRAFGADAAAISNRAPQTNARSVKGSMGPPVIVKPILPKSRTLSTPAAPAQSSTLTRAPVSRSSALPSSMARAPTSRSSALPSTLARAPTSRSSALPLTSTARAPISRPMVPPATARAPPSRSSALPVARASRLPTTTVKATPIPVRSGIGAQTGTVGRSSKSAAAGLADIRERLDRLQARHQTTRTK